MAARLLYVFRAARRKRLAADGRSMPILTAMSSSSWRALGRSMSSGIGPAFPGSRLDTILYPLLAFAPGRGVHRGRRAAVQGLLKLCFDMNTALSLLLFAEEFAKIFAGGAVTAPVHLCLHPLLERAWQRDR